MGYRYEDHEKWLATMEGQKAVGEVVLNAKRVMAVSGCAYITAIWPKAGGSWQRMAAVDRATEMGVLREVQLAHRPMGQYRIFTMAEER